MNNFSNPSFYASLKVARQNVVDILSKYSEEQLLKIPVGFTNNILWNAGHMVTSQQLLCYATSSLPHHIPAHYLPAYRKGTSPANSEGKHDILELKGLLISTIADLEKDYTSGIFTTFTPYVTSFGVTLNCIEDAILFDHIHEGLHFASIKNLMKAI